MIFFGQGPVTICRLVGGGGRGFLGGQSSPKECKGGGGGLQRIDCRSTSDERVGGHKFYHDNQSPPHQPVKLSLASLSFSSSLHSSPRFEKTNTFLRSHDSLSNHDRRNLRPCQSSSESFPHRNGPVPLGLRDLHKKKVKNHRELNPSVFDSLLKDRILAFHLWGSQYLCVSVRSIESLFFGYDTCTRIFEIKSANHQYCSFKVFTSVPYCPVTRSRL